MVDYKKINSLFIDDDGLFQVELGSENNLVFFEDGREFRKLKDEEKNLLEQINLESTKVLQTNKETEEHRWHDDNISHILIFDGQNYFAIVTNSCSPNTEMFEDESDVGFKPLFSIRKLDCEPKKVSEVKYDFQG